MATMADRFKECLKFVLKWEGGLSNHPSDRGGLTNFGITQGVYDSYRMKKGLMTRSVALITKDEVEEIYYKHYWIPSKADKMPKPLDLAVFDTAVNMGVKTAAKLLQRALNSVNKTKVQVDGVIGNRTLNAILKVNDIGKLVKAFLDLREQRYRQIVERNPSQKVFLRGWLNRLNDLRRSCGVKEGG